MHIPIFGSEVRVTPRDLGGALILGVGIIVLAMVLTLLIR